MTKLTLRLLDDPYVVHHWAGFLLPRLTGERSDHPVSVVAGLRHRRESGGISLHRPGMPTRLLLTGFNPRWWERIAGRHASGRLHHSSTACRIPGDHHGIAAPQGRRRTGPRRGLVGGDG
ncbi:hypothetical protein ACGFZK_21265 [Streptomyces sp. NPDC048257]|uniref:hypothetical protein n=1 Tax=Streptomyces sp. NPDC048257 TaxID=3365526 RepID=UPI003716FEF7